MPPSFRTLFFLRTQQLVPGITAHQAVSGNARDAWKHLTAAAVLVP